MDEFIRNYREDLKRFKVSQGAVYRYSIDLLYDKLVKVSKLTRTVNKTIDSKIAYKIILDFFHETVKPLVDKKRNR